MTDGDETRRGEGRPSNVLSIAEALERRAWERLERQTKHRRTQENLVKSATLGRELLSIDFDPLLAEVDPASESAAELRCGRAMQRCLRGETEAGLSEWSAVMAEWPRLAMPYFMRGRWLSSTAPADGLADLDRAAELDPTQSTIYLARGRLYGELRDPDRAVANYRRAVALDARSVDAHHGLAELLAERGDHPGAVAAYGRAIALAPGYIDLHRGRAWSLEALDKWEAAIADYDRILALTPDDHDARFCRALCMHHAGRAAEAAEQLAVCARAAPEDAFRHRRHGVALLDAGDAPAAVVALSRAIELEPEHASAYTFRAQAYSATGDRAGAVADLERAAELDPDDVHAALALLVARAPTPGPEAAAADVGRLVARFPNEWMVAYLDAMHRGRTMTAEDAIALWDRVAAMNPPVADPYVERAKAHARAGHVQAAYDDACRAIELAPNDAWSYTARAIYGTHLDHEEARVTADFDRGVELAPKELFARYHRASWRSGLGDFAGAVDDFDAAIASAPTFAKLYSERGSCRVRVCSEEDVADTDEERSARLEAGVADLEKALELGYEDDGELFFELYLFHTELDDDAAAASAVERGLNIAPGFAALYYARSSMREAAGDAAGAAEDRARATELGWSWGSDA